MSIAISHKHTGTAIPVDKIGGAAVGGFVGYKVTNTLATNRFTRIVTNGLVAKPGGLIGAFGATHFPAFIAAGGAVEAAGAIGPASGLARTLIDGTAATAGNESVKLPKAAAAALQRLAIENPKFSVPSRIGAKLIETAPGAIGYAYGAGTAVHANEWLLGKAKFAGAAGVGILGAMLASSYINRDIVVG